MSRTSDNNHSQLHTHASHQDMTSLSDELRRSRPSQVQTDINSQKSTTAPASAVSSSAASNSLQNSPVMSPEPTVLTTNSSVQASPEPLRGRDEDPCPHNFQLPESILSRKTSSNSLGQYATSAPPTNALAEAVGSSGAGKGSLIRRLSSRASRRITSRRRQSSAAPTSRDGSVGPCFLRRRSDSNTTAPPEFPNHAIDTESELDERDDLSSHQSIFGMDGPIREAPGTTTPASSFSNSAMAAPTIPHQLADGTLLRKVSKKNRSKKMCLIYDTNSNKLTWDKSRPHKSLHVDEIKEVRSGSDIQQYARDFNVSEAERATWFTIIYSVPEKAKLKFMHLIAEDIRTCQLWKETIESLLKHRQEVMMSLMSFDESAVAQYWHSEMAKQFGDQPRSVDQEELDIAAVKRVCQSLHIYSSQSTLETNFELSLSRGRRKLNFQEFLQFVRRTNYRQDVHQLVHRIAARPELGISLEEFLKFVQEEQGEDVKNHRSMWENIFYSFIRSTNDHGVNISAALSKNAQMMSQVAFVAFLTSGENASQKQEPQHYVLDRPMNEYFISSSHNTYLLGRQVAGQSSIEGYISALSEGCRCVEVDCWDGSDGQPQVVHGRTLTSSISFQEVMTTINKYAFVRSRFPLWISLEVHCNAVQQALMADIIKETFGSKLVTEPLDPSSDKLPSPSELMERILIKVKKPRMKETPSPPEFAGRRRGNSLTSPAMKPTIPDGSVLTPSQSLPQSPMLSPSLSGRRFVSKTRVTPIAEGEVHDLGSSGTSDTDSGSEANSVKGSGNKTIKVLGQLGVYCAGVKFTGFDAPEAKKFNHIFSFMESSFAGNSRTKDEKMALDIHNMRYLMRVYPDGKRIASSNFDPLTYWRRGVQMAALNWQTYDLGMQLGKAMFEGGTDVSGYVHKPTELRDIQVLPYNVHIARGKKERSVVSFSIDVISAQQLMRPNSLASTRTMDPYVEVEVFHANDKRGKKEESMTTTHQADTPLKFQTEVIRDNAFNPVFHEGRFKFRITTKHPELVFVRWSVKLSNDGENSTNRPPIAVSTAKLSNLKQGFRTMPLYNHIGEQYLFSKLFCKINIDPIEKTLIDGPRSTPDVSKLNRFGGKVFNRINTSPRGTMERSSQEKSSFES